MRAYFICGIAASLVILSVHPVHAQQYYFARYTPRNGLVNNRVHALYQDHKGRIYFATYGGLSVYDGARFTNYTAGDGLATGLVNDVVEMGDDSLWVIPNAPALQCLVHGILKDIVTSDHFFPIINQLLHASDGYYYAICDDGLFRLENNRFIHVPLKDSNGKEMGKYLNHAIESHHHLFIVNDPNLENVVHAGSLLFYDLATRKCAISPDSISVASVIETPERDILVGTTTGIRRLDTIALRQEIIRPLPAPGRYADASRVIGDYMYFDRIGNLWISSPDAVVRFGKKGDYQTFGPSNGLPAGAVNFILQDRENNMWFANEQNGVVKLVGQQVQYYSSIRPGFTVTDLSTDGAGDSIWFYDMLHHDLLLMEGDKQTIYHSATPLPFPTNIAIGRKAYMVSDHDIYALRFEGDRFYANPVWHDTDRINGRTFFDGSGNLVDPCLRMNIFTGTTMLHQPLPNMSDQGAIDRADRIWTVTRSNELYVFRINRDRHSLQLLRRYGKGTLPEWSPRSLAIDTAGRIWIGTRDRGIYCMRQSGNSLVFERQLTMQDGLSENFINFLHCDPEGNIWASSPTGLDRVRLRDGRVIIDNITLSSDRYDAVYKVISAPGNIRWALARGGVMKISALAGEAGDYSPNVLFSRIQVGDEPVANAGQAAAGGRLTLPYNRNTLSFFVGAPTFINEGLTRYSWLLEGSRDPKWSAPSPRPDIGLLNLPPGKYTLYVKAHFLTGRYPDKTAAYSFTIRPPWWQTWWFRTLFVLACAGIVAALIRIYIRSRLEIQRTRLEKKQAVEKERTRIATDMHDDLGAGLSRIKFLSETIHLKKQMGQPVQDDVGSIGRYADEMIDKMGEIVWALNEKNDSLHDLLSYTRSYAAEYLEQSGIPCTVDAPPADIAPRFVSGEFRRNVYLTIKEALHNIVKHSKARSVTIRIDVAKDLVIVIEDDGVGFDPAGVRPSGNGLNNMRQRVSDIGGQLQIRHDDGTVIRLTVPLPT
jgi:signal transduction histidine kinase/ligand-binding sensor domain-containing protein